jgi:hypothetical protein
MTRAWREVNLAALLNTASRLFAVKVRPGMGHLRDLLGPWRHLRCGAGSAWEQHFFTAPPLAPVVLALPEPENPETGAGRRERSPGPSRPEPDSETPGAGSAPWETPCPPPAGLGGCRQTRADLSGSLPAEPNLPAWEEILPRFLTISLLGALLAPAPARYYQEIIMKP